MHTFLVILAAILFVVNLLLSFLLFFGSVFAGLGGSPFAFLAPILWMVTAVFTVISLVSFFSVGRTIREPDRVDKYSLISIAVVDAVLILVMIL